MAITPSSRHQRVQRSVKNYLGISENEPESVSVIDEIKGHRKEVGPAVSA
jgi:hypothetical protein